jgi:hypothetical protein
VGETMKAKKAKLDKAQAARITGQRCKDCKAYAAIDFSHKGKDWVFCGRCSNSWKMGETT